MLGSISGSQARSQVSYTWPGGHHPGQDVNIQDSVTHEGQLGIDTYHVTWPAGTIGLLMRANYKDTIT